jgi:hypothetical protein
MPGMDDAVYSDGNSRGGGKVIVDDPGKVIESPRVS